MSEPLEHTAWLRMANNLVRAEARIQELERALQRVQRTQCEYGYAAEDERESCVCGACQNERIATAALAGVPPQETSEQ